MPRIVLIPTRTADGRNVILRAAVVSHVEHARAIIRRALRRPVTA